MKFELTEKEQKRYEKFKAKRIKKNKTNKLRFTVCFTPTGIGDNVIVKCSDGKKKDITDVGSW